MRDNSETKTASETKIAVGEPSRLSAFIQAAVAFSVTVVSGTLLSAIAGLFVYANVPDPRTRDGFFLIILATGTLLSLAIGYVAARRAIELDAASGSGPAFSLLKKYRRAISEPGSDAQAGQYSIGEHYLRELLGRRGA
jgi:hypothetical protein